MMTHILPGTAVSVHVSIVKVAGYSGEAYWPHNTSVRLISSS